MSNIQFHKATKTEAKLRMALIGPSGSGKTYTALAVATALVPGGKIAVIDTERGSASKYAGIFAFDTLELAEFHPQLYIDAIKAAVEAGYDVLIVDSMTHAWAGSGGILELHDIATKRQKSQNSWTAWRDVTPLHNQLVDAIVQADLHVIATMRAKMEYMQTKDGDGKAIVQKVGMAAIQREGLEYEFDIVADMDLQNNAVISKTRCPELVGAMVNKPGAELAGIIREWLGGAPASEKPAPVTYKPGQKDEPPIDEAQALYREKATALFRAGKITEQQGRDYVKAAGGDYGKALDMLNADHK
jgi:energy-coupling factor transporter ATP-binding protein EcfA2